MAFDDVRLPEDIERGAIGGPGWRTTIISLANGDEQRNQEWSKTRGEWNISYGIGKRSDFDAVYDFFHARRGRLRGFRFRDWLDYKGVLQPVGTIDGDLSARQIVRLYPDDEFPYTRNVTHPVESTIRVYIDSVLSNDWTLEDAGILQFPGDPGDNVLVTFEYDVPVRFDTDKLDVRINTEDSLQVPSITLVELRQ